MTTDKKHDGASMRKDYINEESILKVSKEVAIKFIEMGRITPSTFDETFRKIHTTIKETVQKG
jgi:transposase